VHLLRTRDFGMVRFVPAILFVLSAMAFPNGIAPFLLLPLVISGWFPPIGLLAFALPIGVVVVILRFRLLSIFCGGGALVLACLQFAYVDANRSCAILYTCSAVSLLTLGLLTHAAPTSRDK